jgi:hypothetical protein
MLSDVATLKRALVDVAAVCVALGLDAGARTQPNGRLVRCPWHDDAHPSCSIRVGEHGTIVVHCFACGAKGDILALIARVHGLDARSQFRHVLAAARALANRCGAGSPGNAATDRGPAAATSPAERAKVARVLLDGGALATSPPAQAYLQGRRLLASAIADGWGALPEAPDRLVHLANRVVVAVGVDSWKRSGFASPKGGIRCADPVLSA